MKNGRFTKRFKKQITIASIVFILILIILLIMLSAFSIGVQALMYICLAVVVSYIVTLYTMLYRERISRAKSTIAYLTEENELLKKNIEPLSYRMEEIDKFRHDARNYMNLIKNEIPNTSEQQKLTAELLSFTDKLRDEELCENILVNMLLKDKKKKAVELDIKFECNVIMPSFLPISSKDICSIFFNLIDNAVTANQTAEKQRDKWITVKSNIIGNYLIIKQSNSVFATVNMSSSGNFLTTKTNRSEHGKGLEIIKEIAERYNGTAEFETKNNVFYSTIYLCLDK